MRGSALLAPALALALVGGCGRDSTPQPVSQAAERSAEPSRGSGHTDLPPQVPDRLEVELRQRTDVGDDTVLKLTPAGARYGLAHGKSRVSLRYRLPADALGPLYQVLRD
ncbi:MAG: hypothetical protein KDK70_42060, partial [Myxococcales bacterium]|nr:hypothetical protein [Myxococcales bacterium]